MYPNLMQSHPSERECFLLEKTKRMINNDLHRKITPTSTQSDCNPIIHHTSGIWKCALSLSSPSSLHHRCLPLPFFARAQTRIRSLCCFNIDITIIKQQQCASPRSRFFFSLPRPCFLDDIFVYVYIYLYIYIYIHM